MTRYKYLVVLLLLVIASACSEAKQDNLSQSLPDTPENRTAVAKRYLAISPPGELLHGAADIAEKSIPEQDRKIFLAVMYSKPLEDTIYRFELDNLVNKFTLKELQALVTYYGSPEGKSAQKKIGALTMDVLFQTQKEVKKAMEMAKGQQPTPPAQPAPPAPQEPKQPQPPSSKP